MEQIKVGIGVMINKDGKVLLAKRKGSHGAGLYAFPGGHLEFGESFEDCVRREVREEAGIEVDNIKFQLIANIKKYGKTHYVHIGVTADYKSGTPKNLEPNRSEPWKWFDIDSPPSPLFEPCRLAFISHRNRQNYFDS